MLLSTEKKPLLVRINVVRRDALALVLILLTSLCLSMSLPAKADFKTIVVPDDYPTLQDAINSAKEGDTIFIRKGTYEEPLNHTLEINKTLSILGENTKNTIIKLYPAYNITWILTQSFYEIANAATIVANDVKLLNLTIVANPAGNVSITGDRTQLLGNNVTSKISIEGSYCNVTENILRDGLNLQGSSNKIARNHAGTIYLNSGETNEICNNTCYSIDLSSSHKNIISGNKLETTSYGYDAISLSSSNNNVIYTNTVSGFNRGLSLFFSSGNLVIANTITDADTAIKLGGSHNNTFYLNNFVDKKYWSDGYVEDDFTDPWFRYTYPNATVSSNFWDNGSLGNHWDNYNGSDINHDGIGETPYTIKIVVRYFEDSEEEVVCGEDNFPLMSRVDINSVNIDLPQQSASPDPSQEPPPETDESFTTILVLATASTLVIVAIATFVYFKKRKH